MLTAHDVQDVSNLPHLHRSGSRQARGGLPATVAATTAAPPPTTADLTTPTPGRYNAYLTQAATGIPHSGGLQAISTLSSTVNNAHAACHDTTLVTSMLASLSSVDESQAGGGEATIEGDNTRYYATDVLAISPARQGDRHSTCEPTSIHTTLSMGVRTIPFCQPQRTRSTSHRWFSQTNHSSLQCSHLSTPMIRRKQVLRGKNVTMHQER